MNCSRIEIFSDMYVHLTGEVLLNRNNLRYLLEIDLLSSVIVGTDLVVWTFDIYVLRCDTAIEKQDKDGDGVRIQKK